MERMAEAKVVVGNIYIYNFPYNYFHTLLNIPIFDLQQGTYCDVHY